MTDRDRLKVLCDHYAACDDWQERARIKILIDDLQKLIETVERCKMMSDLLAAHRMMESRMNLN